MAKPICIRAEELLFAEVKKASSCLESAVSTMSKVDNTVSGWELYIDRAADSFVFSESEGEISACLSALRIQQAQLDKMISVMQNGANKLEDADVGFKNDLDGPGFWERLRLLIYGTATIKSSWLCELFGSSQKQTIYEDCSGESVVEVEQSVSQNEPVASSGVHLDIHMDGYSLKQGDYNAFTQPYGYNAGCCAMAYAIGLSIVTGVSYDPTQFWYGGTTHYDAGHKSGWVSYDPNNIYNSLKEGKPTVLAYIYANSPSTQTDADHFVIVVGVREGADINNLNYEDFIVVDPAYGSERPLTESWKFNPHRVTGGFVMS